MKNLIIAMAFVAIAIQTSAQTAAGGHDGNGGDTYLSQFRESFAIAAQIMKKTDSLEGLSDKLNLVFLKSKSAWIKRLEAKPEIKESLQPLMVENEEKAAVANPLLGKIDMNIPYWKTRPISMVQSIVLAIHETGHLEKIPLTHRELDEIGFALAQQGLTTLSQTNLPQDGNYRLLVNDNNACDIHIETNAADKKVFATWIANQRSGNECLEEKTQIFDCQFGFKCSVVSEESKNVIYLINNNNFLDSKKAKYVFVNNNPVRPASRFTSEYKFGYFNEYGFANISPSSNGQNHCRLSQADDKTIDCDDKLYARIMFCPKAEEIASQQAIKKCQLAHGGQCWWKTDKSEVFNYVSEGVYYPSLQGFSFIVNLSCTVSGSASPW